MVKVRYVAQGFSDELKTILDHDVCAPCPAFIKVILSIASTFYFRLFSHDVTQVYLQCREHQTPLVFLRLRP